jgi:hypothetical protein
MDWERDLENYAEVNSFSLNMIGESPKYGFAEIRRDPAGGDNRVLCFQLNDDDPEVGRATTRTQNEWDFNRGDRAGQCRWTLSFNKDEGVDQLRGWQCFKLYTSDRITLATI